MITVIINGDEKRVAPGSIADMVQALGFRPDKVAVERNRAIVPRSALGAVMVTAGDVFEIVHFVGGG